MKRIRPEYDSWDDQADAVATKKRKELKKTSQNAKKVEDADSTGIYAVWSALTASERIKAANAYIDKNGPYEDLLKSIIFSHNCGHGWRFGVDRIKDTYVSDYKLSYLHDRIVEEYRKTKGMIPRSWTD